MVLFVSLFLSSISASAGFGLYEFSHEYGLYSDGEEIGVLEVISKKQGDGIFMVKSQLKLEFRYWGFLINYQHKEEALINQDGIIRFSMELKEDGKVATAKGTRESNSINISVSDFDGVDHESSFLVTDFDSDPFTDYFNSFPKVIGEKGPTAIKVLNPWELSIHKVAISIEENKEVNWKGSRKTVTVIKEISPEGKTMETWIHGKNLPLFFRGEDYEGILKED